MVCHISGHISVVCMFISFLSKGASFAHYASVSRAKSLIYLEDASRQKKEMQAPNSKLRRGLISSIISSIVLDGPAGAHALEYDDGAIVAESAVPGAYESAKMSLPKRSMRLKKTGEIVTVMQGAIEDGPSGGNSTGSVSGRTGVALWNSGILLTRLLDELSCKDRDIFRGKTVLELGCGTAMASIAASKLGAKDIIATDGNEEVVSLARTNLEQNSITNKASELNTGSGQAAYLKWGTLNAVDFYDTADLIIGSDLTYNSGSWGLLAETLESVLKPNGIIIYLTLGHSGFNMAGELGGFLTLVESRGALELVKEGSPAWPFPSVPSLDQLLYSSLSSKEKEVVVGTGGFKVVILKKKKRR